jgi:hypothetical protein
MKDILKIKLKMKIAYYWTLKKSTKYQEYTVTNNESVVYLTNFIFHSIDYIKKRNQNNL